MNLIYDIPSIFISGLVIGDFFDYLFLIIVGVLLIRNKYIYTDKYFMHRILKNGNPILFEDIISISNNEIIGVFIIRTKTRTYRLPLLFQKNELRKLSEFVKKINNNCQITIY
jgi:hypothetical protein